MDKKEARLIFMGTPEISSYVFEKMILEGFNFVGLISQPDKPVGRKGQIEYSPTKKIAIKYNIPTFQPSKIRLDYEFVKELKPDLIITFAYGQIVPQGLLDIPTFGCLNLHGSLLPKLRGAAPVQYALINNEVVTGVTLMRMVKEMDAGEMYAKEKVTIEITDNATSLFNKIAVAAAKLANDAIPLFLLGKLKGEAQDEKEVTFAPMIKQEQEKLSFDMGVTLLLGWIRALSDKPGGYFILDDKKLKIYKAEILNHNANEEIGKIIELDKNGFIVQAKDGCLSLKEVQLEGKKIMDNKSFANGYSHFKGKVLK
jgi:methionyl-tRNA formyltransferase